MWKPYYTGLALASVKESSSGPFILFFSKSKMTHLFFEKTCTEKGIVCRKKCTGNYKCLGKQSISVDKVITHIIEQKMTDSWRLHIAFVFIPKCVNSFGLTCSQKDLFDIKVCMYWANLFNSWACCHEKPSELYTYLESTLFHILETIFEQCHSFKNISLMKLLYKSSGFQKCIKNAAVTF